MKGKRYVIAVFFFALLMNVIFVANGWHAPISDHHEFRQAQTAIAAKEVARNGITIANYVPVFGPPWNVPMEFPLYQNIVGLLSRFTGVDIVPIGRTISLCFFYFSLPALFLLYRRLVGGEVSGAWFFLSLVLTSPIYLFWSRTVMIESFALACCVWGVWFLLNATEKPGVKTISLASVALILGGLVKITTLAVWLGVACVWLCTNLILALKDSDSRAALIRRYIIGAGVPVALSLIVGYVWIKYGDGIKASNPMTVGLTSKGLEKWNFGSWSQFSPVNYPRWLNLVDTVFTLRGGFIFLVIAAILRPGRRLIQMICVMLFLFPIGIFTNLYFVHDYYYYANGVILLAAVAMVFSDVMNDERFAVTGKVVLWTFVAWNQYKEADYYLSRNILQSQPQLLADKIQQVTRNDQVIISYGFSWNPALAYYSDRRFVMVSAKMDADVGGIAQVLKSIPGGVSAMLVNGAAREDKIFLKRQIQILGLQSNPVYSTQEGELYIR